MVHNVNENNMFKLMKPSSDKFAHSYRWAVSRYGGANEIISYKSVDIVRIWHT